MLTPSALGKEGRYTHTFLRGVDSHPWTENGLASTGCLPVPILRSDSYICHFTCSHCGRRTRSLFIRNPGSTKALPPSLIQRPPLLPVVPAKRESVQKPKQNKNPNPLNQAAGRENVAVEGYCFLMQTWTPQAQPTVPEPTAPETICSQWARAALNTRLLPVVQLCKWTLCWGQRPAALCGRDEWVMEPPGQPLSGTYLCSLQAQPHDANPRSSDPLTGHHLRLENHPCGGDRQFLRKHHLDSGTSADRDWVGWLKPRGVGSRLNSEWFPWVISNLPQFPHVRWEGPPLRTSFVQTPNVCAC